MKNYLLQYTQLNDRELSVYPTFLAFYYDNLPEFLYKRTAAMEIEITAPKEPSGK